MTWFKKKKSKVLVAMSGGVDSSVAAALLVREGYDVTGAYMKQWSDSTELSGVCSWKEDRRDALRVAAELGIDLITLDFEEEYREWVMGYMFREYESGRTPNPDVMCNKYVKFGYWLREARARGFDYLATGHYARLHREGARYKSKRNKRFEFFRPHLASPRSKEEHQVPPLSIPTSRHQCTLKGKLEGVHTTKLLQAVDTDKDQTYFLHQLSSEQLEHVLFPLGGYTKAEVRALAKKFSLPTATRAESMGICFVGEVPMKEFLEQKIEHRTGDIVTEDGIVVGTHDGLAFYTVGQRSQFTVHNAQFTDPDTNDVLPAYVVGKDIEKNQLIVGTKDSPLLYKAEVAVSDMHWISGEPPVLPLTCEVRMRHRQELQEAEFRIQNSQNILTFETSQRAVTPGQFAVLYKDGVCLGGGAIV